MLSECPHKYAKVEHEPHEYIFGGRTYKCAGYKEKKEE